MLTFPEKARVGRNMPKEAFYKRLKLNTDLRDKFVTDIKHIVLEYKLTPVTLNLEKEGKTAEILILSLELKKKELDYRIVENIARQNSHKLLFLLKFQEQGQLAIYYAKLYKSGWKLADNLKLEARGLTLDSIWEGFIEQIALGNVEYSNKNAELSLDEKLKRHEAILKMQKEIVKLERLSWKEKQPKKKFELFTRMKSLQKELNKMQS